VSDFGGHGGGGHGGHGGHSHGSHSSFLASEHLGWAYDDNVLDVWEKDEEQNMDSLKNYGGNWMAVDEDEFGDDVARSHVETRGGAAATVPSEPEPSLWDKIVSWVNDTTTPTTTSTAPAAQPIQGQWPVHPFDAGTVAGPKVKAAQTKLNAMGLGPLVVDGIIGPKTQASVKAFQKRAALPQTGLLDAGTLMAMGV
jgi:hypothetical protein